MNLSAPDEISAYVEEVRRSLAHLPSATRDELLEDLPEHLAELLPEGGRSLTERLGAPQAYAAELSASAGITGAGYEPRPPAGAARLARLRSRIGAATRRADHRFGPLLGYARASEFLVLLRPAWWVLRGYLAAMAFAYVFYNAGAPLGLLPRIEDNELLAVLLLAGAVLGSVWLGRRGPLTRPLHRYALRAGTAALLLFAVVGFFEIDSESRQSGYLDVQYVNEYGGVADVFVYDADGRLLRDVQLYDQNGQPLRFGDGFGDGSCVDEMTGTWQGNRRPGYPRCPQQAPFPVVPSGDPETPEPTGSAAAVPSQAPSANPAPVPSGGK